MMHFRRWLIFGVLCACAQNAKTTLVRVDQETPGDNCEYGGLAISTGRDLNHDGVLTDNEIAQTQYVCNGGTTVRCAGGTVHTGAVTINDASEFATLAGVNCIDGDLIVSGVGGEIPLLPDLNTVTGEIVVAGNADITTLDGLSGLRDVGQSYLVYGNDSLQDLSELTQLDQVLSIFIVGNNALHDLADFATVSDLPWSITVSNNPALTSLHGLENLYTTKNGLSIRGNPSLIDVSALSNLRSVGSLDVSSNSSLTDLTLPNLEKADVRVLVNLNAALQNVSLPRLATLADGLMFNGNTQLASISMPSLLTTGIITFENDTSLATIDAHALGFVTTDLSFNNLSAVTNADFSALKTVAGTLRVYGTSPWSFSTFGNVTSVGSLVVVSAGMPDFTGLSRLQSVAGNMSVWSCPQFTAFNGLDAMTDIGGNLYIVTNPMLQPSVAQAFVSTVNVHGTVTIQ